MTTYGGLSRWPGTLAPPLTWEGWKEAMRTNTGVMVAAIVGGVVVTLAAIGAVVLLVMWERDTSALFTMVNLLITAFVLKQGAETRATARTIAENTNGTQARLIDAAVGRTGGSDGSAPP